MIKKIKNGPKILLLDIELAPNLATVWDIWNQNINLSNLLETSYVLCWSAKWLGTKDVMFDSVNKSGKLGVIKSIWKLLDECDIVIHYNGQRFDIPVLNKEFLLARLLPPRPYKQIDLLRTIKKEFRFVSNKLAHITEQLGLKGKIKTNHQLWLDCMNGDIKAWKKMEEYNKRDITELEDVYNIVLPWITNHPNMGLYLENNNRPTCTNCGSWKLHSRGLDKTKKWKWYQCQECGTWVKEKNKEKKK